MRKRYVNLIDMKLDTTIGWYILYEVQIKHLSENLLFFHTLNKFNISKVWNHTEIIIWKKWLIQKPIKKLENINMISNFKISWDKRWIKEEISLNYLEQVGNKMKIRTR